MLECLREQGQGGSSHSFADLGCHDPGYLTPSNASLGVFVLLDPDPHSMLDSNLDGAIFPLFCFIPATEQDVLACISCFLMGPLTSLLGRARLPWDILALNVLYLPTIYVVSRLRCLRAADTYSVSQSLTFRSRRP